MSLQGMMSSLVWMRPVGGAVPQLLINLKKNCNSRFFRDKRQPYNSIMKRQTVRILNFPEWLAVFLSLLSGGCESCWETPAGVRAAFRALPGVMVQIYLYKNQWVAKLKRGCRGEETIWKMNCPFNAQWRILSTSQRSDAFNHSLEFFLLLFVVPSGQQPTGIPSGTVMSCLFCQHPWTCPTTVSLVIVKLSHSGSLCLSDALRTRRCFTILGLKMRIDWKHWMKTFFKGVEHLQSCGEWNLRLGRTSGLHQCVLELFSEEALHSDENQSPW